MMVAQQAAVERKGAPVMYVTWAPMSVPFVKIGRMMSLRKSSKQLV
jgi:hypothetical protein